MNFDTTVDEQGILYVDTDQSSLSYIFYPGPGMPEEDITPKMVEVVIKYMDAQDINISLTETFNDLYKKLSDRYQH